MARVDGKPTPITLYTTRDGKLRCILIGDVELPLEYVTDVTLRYDPLGSIVDGSFTGSAIIETVEEQG